MASSARSRSFSAQPSSGPRQLAEDQLIQIFELARPAEHRDLRDADERGRVAQRGGLGRRHAARRVVGKCTRSSGRELASRGVAARAAGAEVGRLVGEVQLFEQSLAEGELFG